MYVCHTHWHGHLEHQGDGGDGERYVDHRSPTFTFFLAELPKKVAGRNEHDLSLLTMRLGHCLLAGLIETMDNGTSIAGHLVRWRKGWGNPL